MVPRLLKFFTWSTQVSLKFILLMNIKMPTIVGILIFICRIDFMLSSDKQEESLNCLYFNVNEQSKFYCQLNWEWKKLYKLGHNFWTTLLMICWKLRIRKEIFLCTSRNCKWLLLKFYIDQQEKCLMYIHNLPPQPLYNTFACIWSRIS